MKIEILYEDNHVLVLNKPAGALTQEDNSGEESLENAARAFIKERDQKPRGVFLYAIHRLDKAASGIVVFAKSKKALSRLSQSFREKKCRKEYIAIVEGAKPPDGTLSDYLIHGDHQAIVVQGPHPKAKLSELSIVASEPIGENKWLLTIVLSTGRYHQIRIQLASRGYAILGDAKYGSTSPFQFDGIALHHARIFFPHPTQKSFLSVAAPCSFWPL
jgi:23S rRNA pseudouridine1911/1915/1917 synthase